MTASATDKLKKYKSLFSTTLSTGIGTGTGDTITPASVSGLPTDTAITLTFDRVDSGGVATPTKMERIVGVISGGNFTSYVRGVDGTTEQAHTAGAVIEMIWNADDWNDAVDWALTQHNQDGTHGAITSTNASMVTASMVTPTINTGKFITSINDANGNEVIKTPATTSAVNEITVTNAAAGNAVTISATGGDDNISLELAPKGTGAINITGKIGGTAIATGAEVTTGTDDTQIVTPKALGDAGVNTRLKSKTIQITRDGTASSGDVSYTGIGFVPTSIECVMCVDGTSYWSKGHTDSALASNCIYGNGAGNTYKSDGYLIQYSNQSGFSQNAVVKSYNADGFTLTYTKVGSPSANTMGIYIICYR